MKKGHPPPRDLKQNIYIYIWKLLEKLKSLLGSVLNMISGRTINRLLRISQTERLLELAILPYGIVTALSFQDSSSVFVFLGHFCFHHSVFLWDWNRIGGSLRSRNGSFPLPTVNGTFVI